MVTCQQILLKQYWRKSYGSNQPLSIWSYESLYDMEPISITEYFQESETR